MTTTDDLVSEYVYEAKFSIDLGKAIPAVGELLDSVNDHLSMVGVHDRLSASGEAFSLIVRVNRRLSAEDEHKMRVLLEANAIEMLPQYGVRLTSFRSQSVTPKSSVG